MKHIGHAFTKKKPSKNFFIDEKTIFHVFRVVIEEEYGVRGKTNIVPTFFKNRILFVSFRQSVWAQELWTRRIEIVKKLNIQLGSQAVKDIKVSG